jgi:cob(I)alamin adenosyltransferase
VSISTGSGDDGTTGVIGASSETRLPKDHPRIECLGDLDELNAFLGDARCAAGQDRTRELIEAVQRDLFIIAAITADPGGRLGGLHPGGSSAAAGPEPPDPERLGAWIRKLEEGAPVKGFTLPGANPASAKLHIARAVCRRAERRLAGLARRDGKGAALLRYMNRLSDLLFLLAREEEAPG